MILDAALAESMHKTSFFYTNLGLRQLTRQDVRNIDTVLMKRTEIVGIRRSFAALILRLSITRHAPELAEFSLRQASR